jgi:SAM-dependent methyltransferase
MADTKEETSYSKGRIHDYLLGHSDTYKLLQDEQVAGWNSAALDWWYKRHVKSAVPVGDKRPRDEVDKVPGSTVFKSNTVELCERYRAHASKILPAANPVLFKSQLTQRGRNVGLTCASLLTPTKSTGLRFLDLGCAPGGVSAFLTQNCGWTGVGVTLSEEQGGIELPPWTHAASQQFSAVLDSIFSASLNVQIMRALELLHLPKEASSFDFVNGGAVADFGQQSNEEVSPLERDFELAFFKKPVSHPKHLFVFAQLLIALKWVKPGGSIMLVIGLGEVGSLMMMIHHLLPMFKTETTVQLLETMHLMKPPVYVLITGIYPTEESIRSLRMEIATQQKPDYWLGTTDQAFEVSKVVWDLKLGQGGLSMGEQIERFWVKKRNLLADRRKVAEGQFSKLS